MSENNSDLRAFENPEFGSVRTIVENDKVLFCASDVAKALGYAKPGNAISRHCKGVVKRDTPISRKVQEINYILEGDVYRLIVHSKLPVAKKDEKAPLRLTQTSSNGVTEAA